MTETGRRLFFGLIALPGIKAVEMDGEDRSVLHYCNKNEI